MGPHGPVWQAKTRNLSEGAVLGAHSFTPTFLQPAMTAALKVGLQTVSGIYSKHVHAIYLRSSRSMKDSNKLLT